MKFIEVSEKNKKLAIDLQSSIFPNEKSPDQVIKGIKTKNPTNYIVRYNGENIGIIGHYFMSGVANHVFLNWFGVLPEHRRKGYGKRILEEYIEKCKKIGEFSYLTLYTSKVHNDIAVRLYNKVGFDVRPYSNDRDVRELNELGVVNDYLICIYKLKDNCTEVVDDIDLDISGNIRILRNFN